MMTKEQGLIANQQKLLLPGALEIGRRSCDGIDYRIPTQLPATGYS